MTLERSKSVLHRIALIAALLFAQVVSSGHIDLDDSHPAGEACAICVVHASLGSADVPAAVAVDVQVQRPEVIAYQPARSSRQRVIARLARGPPSVS